VNGSRKRPATRTTDKLAAVGNRVGALGLGVAARRAADDDQHAPGRQLVDEVLLVERVQVAGTIGPDDDGHLCAVALGAVAVLRRLEEGVVGQGRVTEVVLLILC
jgi:hypothetical protein